MPTTQQYLDKLVTLKSQLASNLRAKGIDAKPAELYDTLIPKVMDIVTSEPPIVTPEFVGADYGVKNNSTRTAAFRTPLGGQPGDKLIWVLRTNERVIRYDQMPVMVTKKLTLEHQQIMNRNASTWANIYVFSKDWEASDEGTIFDMVLNASGYSYCSAILLRGVSNYELDFYENFINYGDINEYIYIPRLEYPDPNYSVKYAINVTYASDVSIQPVFTEGTTWTVKYGVIGNRFVVSEATDLTFPYERNTLNTTEDYTTRNDAMSMNIYFKEKQTILPKVVSSALCLYSRPSGSIIVPPKVSVNDTAIIHVQKPTNDITVDIPGAELLYTSTSTTIFFNVYKKVITSADLTNGITYTVSANVNIETFYLNDVSAYDLTIVNTEKDGGTEEYVNFNEYIFTKSNAFIVTILNSPTKKQNFSSERTYEAIPTMGDSYLFANSYRVVGLTEGDSSPFMGIMTETFINRCATNAKAEYFKVKTTNFTSEAIGILNQTSLIFTNKVAVLADAPSFAADSVNVTSSASLESAFLLVPTGGQVGDKLIWFLRTDNTFLSKESIETLHQNKIKLETIQTINNGEPLPINNRTTYIYVFSKDWESTDIGFKLRLNSSYKSTAYAVLIRNGANFDIDFCINSYANKGFSYLDPSGVAYPLITPNPNDTYYFAYTAFLSSPLEIIPKTRGEFTPVNATIENNFCAFERKGFLDEFFTDQLDYYAPKEDVKRTATNIILCFKKKVAQELPQFINADITQTGILNGEKITFDPTTPVGSTAFIYTTIYNPQYTFGISGSPTLLANGTREVETNSYGYQYWLHQKQLTAEDIANGLTISTDKSTGVNTCSVFVMSDTSDYDIKVADKDVNVRSYITYDLIEEPIEKETQVIAFFSGATGSTTGQGGPEQTFQSCVPDYNTRILKVKNFLAAPTAKYVGVIASVTNFGTDFIGGTTNEYVRAYLASFDYGKGDNLWSIQKTCLFITKKAPPTPPDPSVHKTEMEVLEEALATVGTTFTYRAIALISNSNDTFTNTASQGNSGAEWFTSDGAHYTGNSVTHTWDKTKDTDPYGQGYGSRWVMYCRTNESGYPITPGDSIYVIVDGGIISNGAVFKNCVLLREVRFKNGAKYKAGMVVNYALFNGCSSLIAIENLDLSLNEGIMENSFTGPNGLITVKNVVGIRNNIKLPCNYLSRESILNIFNALENNTSGTAKTITLHSLAKARLSAEDLLIATNKNWTVA